MDINNIHLTYHYQKIIEKIKSLINSQQLKPGDRIPSVEEIQKNFNVSHITARRVFKDLAAEGLIYNIRGKGYFVIDAKRSAGKKRCIASMVRPFRIVSYFDNYFNEINSGIQRECLSNGYDLLYPHAAVSISESEAFMDKDASEEIIRSAMSLEDKVDGFILDGCLADEVIRRILDNTGKPAVLVDRHLKLPIDCVHADNQKGTQAAAGMAVRMGYDHFFVLRSGNDDSNRKERGVAFLDALHDRKIPPSNIHIVEDAYIKHWDLVHEEIMSVNTSLGDTAKILIFTSTDALGRWLCDKLVAQKIKVGERIGLLSCQGMGYATYKKPELSTLMIDTEKMGRMAVNVLLDRIKNNSINNPMSHVVEVTLMMGQTI